MPYEGPKGYWYAAIAQNALYPDLYPDVAARAEELRVAGEELKRVEDAANLEAGRRAERAARAVSRLWTRTGGIR